MPAGFTRKSTASSQPKSHMLKAVSILFAVSVCGLLARAYTPTTSSALAQELLLSSTGSNTMDPFTKVVICAPVNVKVVPNTEYKVAVVADEAVKNAISTRVHQGTLSIEVKKGFWTDKAVQLTVGLPDDQLQLVHNKAPATTVAVAAGFNVRHFTGINAGSAALFLKGLNAEEASLQNTGVGTIVAKGNLRSVQIEGAGVSKVYLKGSLRSVYVDLNGISEVHLSPTSDDLRIRGSIDSLSKVYYTRGRCDIGQGAGGVSGVGAMAAGGIGAFAGNMHIGNMAGNMNVFGGGCQQVQTVKFPKAQPTWTCGLEVTGKWTCAGCSSGSSASSTTSGNGGSFTSTGRGSAMSMSSSSGGGNSFSSSNGNGRMSMYSTDEGTVLLRPCSVSEESLSMFPDGTAVM